MKINSSLSLENQSLLFEYTECFKNRLAIYHLKDDLIINLFQVNHPLSNIITPINSLFQHIKFHSRSKYRSVV